MITFKTYQRPLLLDVGKSTLITLDEEDVLKEGNKIIEIVPAWKYLLKSIDVL